jgi:hypothetical protein
MIQFVYIDIGSTLLEEERRSRSSEKFDNDAVLVQVYSTDGCCCHKRNVRCIEYRCVFTPQLKLGVCTSGKTTMQWVQYAFPYGFVILRMSLTLMVFYSKNRFVVRIIFFQDTYIQHNENISKGNS